MRTVLAILLSSFAMVTLSARGEESKPTPEPAEATKAAEAEFVPPHGWKAKKRGKFTVYCRKDQAMGTRFPKETCYDEEGIRAMLAAQLDDREKVDQMRRICGSQAACGAN